MQMQSLTLAVCFLVSLLTVFVLADNVALNQTDALRDGRLDTCISASFADFYLAKVFNVTHIRVYTNYTQSVSVDLASAAQPLWSSSYQYVDFFCTRPKATDRIVIRNLGSSTCEIEVGTCPVDSSGKRYYGTACATPCSDSCLNGLCGSNTGTCFSCPAGRTGPHCDEACPDDHYGSGCSSPCPPNCPRTATGRVCDVTNGNCIQPCPVGKQGSRCDQACTNDYYGSSCTSPCPTTCPRPASGRMCDVSNGDCTQLCPAGKKGRRCDQDCQSNYYGQKCTQSCSGNCQRDAASQRQCHPETGVCLGSCPQGKRGVYCDQECAAGTYGGGDITSCPSQCGNCKDGSCRATNGVCNRGCLPGWQPDLCQQACDDGKFGDCRKQCACRNGSEVCQKSTGQCQSGCRDGREGEDCLQDCRDRYFGNCQTPCRCKNPTEVCGKVTGNCKSGCPDGKSGDNCYQCQAGRYGGDCENTCRCRDQSEACDAASGACKSGCPAGWKGSDCQHKCDDGMFGDSCGGACQMTCANSSCHHVTGHCALGCVEGWEGDFCNKQPSHFPVAAVVGAVAAIILIVIIVVVIRHWRRKKGKMADDICEEVDPSRRYSSLAGVSNHNYDNVEEENEGAVVVSNPETMEAMYSNATPLARPSNVIPVSDLPKRLTTWRHDSHYSTEFQSLPQGLTEPHSAAYSAENKSKNRYANICAYDHSRVKLSVPPDSGQTDYINACFVDGYKSPRQFIASQGPNDVIINDFVRMLLEHDVSTVVMLTNLYEEGKLKCNQYWPEKTEAMFGGIKMTLTSMVTRRDYVIRSLTLSTKGGQRSVSLRHFHFLSWPDKGVPTSPWPLLDFRDVALQNAPSGRPVVVHCSAGIGRTGTFIAMDVLLRKAQAEASIDVLQCVTALRQARTHMVQTVEQYGFLHEAALVGLCAAGSAVPTDVFLQRYSRLLSPPGANKSAAAKEFQKLLQCPFNLSEEEIAIGKQAENKNKNVDPNILPVASARVQLQTSIPDGNGYINAIFLSDYDARDRFILTQTPGANTVREFWAMVADFNVTAIVSLDSSPDESFWPEKEEAFGSVKVKVLPPTSAEHFLVSSATISTDGKSTSLKRFQLKTPPDSLSSKSDPRPLVTLREEVDKVKGDDRVLVHSRDGAGLGGIYCVLSVLLRRAITDSVVALPYSLSLVKRLRPQTVQSQGEYEFLYMAAKHNLDHYQPQPSDVSGEYTENENIYTNQEMEAVYGNA